MTFPQVIAFEQAVTAAQATGEERSVPVLRYQLLSGLLPCVEKWDIVGIPQGVTPETFPATPAVASARLIDWLTGEIAALLKDDEEDNGSKNNSSPNG